MSHTTPYPRDRAPALTFPVVNGAAFDLSAISREAFTHGFFHRGLHGPICEDQMEERRRRRSGRAHLRPLSAERPLPRPRLDDFLAGLKFVMANDYPVRGAHPAGT